MVLLRLLDGGGAKLGDPCRFAVRLYRRYAVTARFPLRGNRLHQYSLGIALDPETVVLDLVAYAYVWAGFGAACGPILILSLYWRRMTRPGALAGIVAGGVTMVVYKQLEGGPLDVFELVPGFLLSLAAAWLASMTGSHAPRTPRSGIRTRPGRLAPDHAVTVL